MASYQWIKLYDEILDDPKMGRLSDGAYRFCINLFLLASRHPARDGSLPELCDIAWTLRLNEQTALSHLQELVKVGIVVSDDAGIFVSKFAVRQSAVDVTERMKQYRDRKRKSVTPDVTPENNNGYELVTQRNTDIDIDQDKEEDKKRGNIYIAPLPDAMVAMIAALTKATKTKYGAGFNEDKFEQAAAIMLRDGVTIEQVESFPGYWRDLGWGGNRGLPTLEKVVEEMDNCIRRVDTRPKPSSNGNGRHEKPVTIDPLMPKPGQGGVY